MDDLQILKTFGHLVKEGETVSFEEIKGRLINKSVGKSALLIIGQVKKPFSIAKTKHGERVLK
jgi:hypothetical protein